MQIELRPHRGVNLATRRETDLGQDRIFVDGVGVGYVARKPDAPINIVERGLGPDVHAAIGAAVQAKYGGQAALLSEPVEIPEEYLAAGSYSDPEDEAEREDETED